MSFNLIIRRENITLFTWRFHLNCLRFQRKHCSYKNEFVILVDGTESEVGGRTGCKGPARSQHLKSGVNIVGMTPTRASFVYDVTRCGDNSNSTPLYDHVDLKMQ